MNKDTLQKHLLRSKFLAGLVSVEAVDAYLESLHTIIKRFEDQNTSVVKELEDWLNKEEYILCTESNDSESGREYRPTSRSLTELYTAYKKENHALRR